MRLVHMNVLLGFVQDAIIGELFKYKYSKSEGWKDCYISYLDGIYLILY